VKFLEYVRKFELSPNGESRTQPADFSKVYRKPRTFKSYVVVT